MNGVLLLHKKPGVTSFQALSPLKKRFPKTKIGHCGTLDRFASGLLVVLLGRMTRLSNIFTGLDKSYHSTFRFGQETDTLDPEGQVIKTASLPASDILLPIEQFLGPQVQVPPIYSAIHVQGKRASDCARAGKEITLNPRNIYIHQFLAQPQWPHVHVDVTCSKGTYIRSLARDFAAACSSCAHVEKLERYWIGHYDGQNASGFHLDAACFIEDVEESKVLSINEVISLLPRLCVVSAKSSARKAILQGQPLKEEWFEGEITCEQTIIFDADKNFLGLVRKQEGQLSYGLVNGEHSDL